MFSLFNGAMGCYNKIYACHLHSRFYFQTLYLDFAIFRRHSTTDSAKSYFRQGTSLSSLINNNNNTLLYKNNTFNNNNRLNNIINKMPNIVNEMKLDFKDVLLRPKRSTLKSRNDVSY